MLSKYLIQFSVEGWGCVPSLYFGLRPNCGRVMEVMATSFKRTYARTVVLIAPDPTAGHCQPITLLETPIHSQASLLWCHCSFLLSPGAHNVLFVASKSLFLQSCGSSVMKSHWSSKSNFPGGSQSLCQIRKLGNLLQALELLQQCENFFVIIVLQFVDCLLSGSVIGLTPHASQVSCNQSPWPQGSHS